MDYGRLGDTGLMLSRLGLGTMQFGWSIDEDASRQVLDGFVERGGTFLDTADIYSNWSGSMGGPPNPGGVSEEIIGRWLSDRGNRDDLVVATKVRGPMGEEGAEGRDSRHQREGLSRRWVLQACEDSLRRLQVDHIDLYQVHFPDPLVPIDETLSALTDLVRQGKVRYLGCSNFSAWRLVESLWVADTGGHESFVSVQPEYNLLEPVRADVERSLAPACREHGIGVVPYSPLGAGLLTGKYRRGDPLPDSVRADENAERRFSDRNWEIIETVVEVAERNDATPAQVAIAWQLGKEFVTAPIVGANTVEQLADTMGALDVELPDADRSLLDDVSAFEVSRADRE